MYALAVTLNVVVLLSTVMWQGRLHAQLALAGKSDTSIDLLVRTNWIRTGAFTIQAAIAVTLLTKALAKGF